MSVSIPTSITVQEINDPAVWNGFLTSQPRGHLLQAYEWGELHKYLGGTIYRLGALENGRLVGVMLLTLANVPVPGLRLKWLYSSRGPTLERPDPDVLTALVDYAHKVGHKEHVVVLRVRAERRR